VTRRGKRTGKGRSLKMLKGNREALERELLWNIALDGDPQRKEQLCRMLQPAANDQLSIVPQVSPLRQGDERGDE
jgi:hypothetical protein